MITEKDTLKAELVGVILKFDIPASFEKGDPTCSAHDAMLSELLKLPRCHKICCGHWAWVSFEYEDLTGATKLCYHDALEVQKIAEKYRPNLMLKHISHIVKDKPEKAGDV